MSFTVINNPTPQPPPPTASMTISIALNGSGTPLLSGPATPAAALPSAWPLLACAAGSYASAGPGYCSPCGVGTYSEGCAGGSCVACSPGSFSSGGGQVHTLLLQRKQGQLHARARADSHANTVLHA